jgi:hypothetical protein
VPPKRRKQPERYVPLGTKLVEKYMGNKKFTRKYSLQN